MAVLFAVLGGWWLLRDGPEPGAGGPSVAGPRSSSASAPATTDPDPDSDPDRQTIDQLTFLDEDYGIALRLDCTTINPAGYCHRSLLDTLDGGVTWNVRGALPASSDGYARLLVDSSGPLAVVDENRLAAMVRSADRGATWRPVQLREGPPAPAPPGAQLLTDALPNCQVGCGRLLWVDVSGATTHQVPTQPLDGDSDLWFAAPGTADGLLTATDRAGTVAVSPDGGVSWRVTFLPVAVPPDQTLGGSVVRPSGGDRIYVFVQLEGSVGLETTYGFRSDDAGVTWTDIGFEGRTVWIPAGVVQGELVTTNLPGGVFLSTDAGTAFTTVPETPPAMFLSQGDPGGVVLGTVFDQQGRSTYWLSRDGRGWSPLLLPTD
ncbi:MAG: hypothetical protein H0T85_01115 [Geodermatophilaceae bacterium]|nr:hypothetical protein [Geodermatophilaceae bacterium]